MSAYNPGLNRRIGGDPYQAPPEDMLEPQDPFGPNPSEFAPMAMPVIGGPRPFAGDYGQMPPRGAIAPPPNLGPPVAPMPMERPAIRPQVPPPVVTQQATPLSAQAPMFGPRTQGPPPIANPAEIQWGGSAATPTPQQNYEAAKAAPRPQPFQPAQQRQRAGSFAPTTGPVKKPTPQTSSF